MHSAQSAAMMCLGLVGTKDLKQHEQTSLHGWCDWASLSCTSLQSYFGGPSCVMAVIKVEVMLSKHHLPFLLADHCTKLFQSMFRDSAIDKKFQVQLH